MPRPTASVDPDLRAHQEWLGYLQPVGLVVAPAAMVEAGWVLTRSGSELTQRQERFREALEPLRIGAVAGENNAGAEAEPDADSDGDADADTAARGFRDLEQLLTQHLGWEMDQLDRSEAAIRTNSKELPELGETLAPTAVVPAAQGEGVQMLVVELPLGMALDQRVSGGEQLWRASAQERLERLLRETGVEAGLLFNGRQLRLVVAPKGESSGHLTFPLAELAEVSGRLMFSGLTLLLGVSAVFFDPDGVRLLDVLRRSRSFQAVVSNALADQVLAALWELLRGFQQADQLGGGAGHLLRDLPERDPQQLYGGLITVLMRLVFLLYAEDEALMPSDAVYEQNYKVSAIFEQLQRDAADYPDTMEQRYGAWAGLMSLCRLVFDGGGPSADYLPARHGQLFDPTVYPWLETPWISDGVVHAVLANLLIVKGERISYRALDVEQIGSVYEGIMGYAVRRMTGRCIGLKSKPQGAKKQLTTAVDLDALLAVPGRERKAWLEEQAATNLPAQAATALRNASTETELLAALRQRINHDLFDGPQPAGSLVFQPTQERRRSGSHYTPRSLTRPIVEEALRPWLERCDHRPTAAQILELKICDPAMGSGAFLVESCRYLAELLERAWSREGLPEALQPGAAAHGEEPLLYARRLVAQSCLYGVDKNPFAVNLARLSLWLVSLSKDAPFTFVDHALKCGDSLVGVERREIEAALRSASRQRELWETELRSLGQQQSRSLELFHTDSRSDEDDDRKRQALHDLEASTAYLRTVGDLLVAAFFNGSNARDRRAKREVYLSATVSCDSAEELEEVMAEPLEALREGEKGIQPLHWDIAFPDVFERERPGFDVFVGNPPFIGGRRIGGIYGDDYKDWLQQISIGGNANSDIVAHFFRRCYSGIRSGGTMGLIATNTIAQGDTRGTGLRWICLNGGDIYSAVKRYKWPGMASVVVSVVHVHKGVLEGDHYLDGRRVERITAFLLANGSHEDPKQLDANLEKSFQGSIVLGMGFTFDDSGEADEERAGIPIPISTIQRFMLGNPSCIEVIYPYIGGEELNTSPTHAHHRFVVDFRDASEEDCRLYWPAIMDLLEKKVKPERTRRKPNGEFVLRSPLPQKWWQHADKRPALYEAVRGQRQVLMHSFTSKYLQFGVLDSRHVYAGPHIVFALPGWEHLALLQSRIHEVYAIHTSSTMRDDLSYKATDTFETFPFPVALLDVNASAPAHAIKKQRLDSIGDNYHQLRANLMVANNEGLTKTYNRFHAPEEDDSGILQLRTLHTEMDQAVLNAYGWSDIPTTCGYGLDYLDSEEDAELPTELQDRIDSGELYFETADDACDFEAQLRAYGAVRGNRKLPWRYRWPDSVREEVLARLLALNAERYAEEVAQGKHG